jgi:hypothetical protein
MEAHDRQKCGHIRSTFCCLTRISEGRMIRAPRPVVMQRRVGTCHTHRLTARMTETILPKTERPAELLSGAFTNRRSSHDYRDEAPRRSAPCWRRTLPPPGESRQWVTAQMRLYPQINPRQAVSFLLRVGNLSSDCRALQMLGECLRHRPCQRDCDGLRI